MVQVEIRCRRCLKSRIVAGALFCNVAACATVWKTVHFHSFTPCYPESEMGQAAQPMGNTLAAAGSYPVERRHLERQIIYARVVFVILAVTAVLLEEPQGNRGRTGVFLFAYLGIAVAVLWLRRTISPNGSRISMYVDIGALAILLLLTPSIVPFWIVYLFVAWTAGVRWGLQRSAELAGAVTLAVLLHAAFYIHLDWSQLLSWAALLAGTSTAGVGLAFLGDRYRRQSVEHDLLTRLIGMLQVEQGTAESLRGALQELTSSFQGEKAMLVFEDVDLERVFVWTVAASQEARITPESRPLAQADSFLLDRQDAVIAWNKLDPPVGGFGWDRRNGRKLAEIPSIGDPARQELALRSFMSVPLDFGGHAVGRIMLCNARGRWWPQDLQRFERVVWHLGLPLHNLFLLRHIRARAIEGERSRISRDIHDGILQTLLSVDMQLGVLFRKVRQAPDQAAAALDALAADRPQRDGRAAPHGHRHAPRRGRKRRPGRADAGLRGTVPKRIRPGPGPAPGRRRPPGP